MSFFSIFKAEKKSEKSPDYRITMKVNDKFVEIGGCWIKETEKGKYFSCKLNAPYKDRVGYEIKPVIPNKTTDVIL